MYLSSTASTGQNRIEFLPPSHDAQASGVGVAVSCAEVPILLLTTSLRRVVQNTWPYGAHESPAMNSTRYLN